MLIKIIKVQNNVLTTDTDTSLPNMDKVPTWDNTTGGIIRNSNYGYLPSDVGGWYFTGATCVTDSLTKYGVYTIYISSPYLADGTQNPAYINTVEATTANCLSGFDGKGNTELLVGLEYTSAAKACYKYGITAIPADNWYLPAMGELGYIIPRYSVINTSLNTVSGVQLISDEFYGYWSSTEYDDFRPHQMHTYEGSVTYFSQPNPGYVRAFASVPVE